MTMLPPTITTLDDFLKAFGFEIDIWKGEFVVKDYGDELPFPGSSAKYGLSFPTRKEAYAGALAHIGKLLTGQG